ncbi:hypothetical protein [Rhodococcus tukisamuensis]|uniref:Uncharacterized protein n=1 Tax=Rhodococcus tukisamuensis TaxID=168276 RepID=A0A1G6UAV4_9NOCA|nr:hypothetical protein [Rhodococcus tukisamuensis]SDD38520.1 hypothetical protein SAMN05444580_104132 [Rhodococcus tukisamuensis]
MHPFWTVVLVLIGLVAALVIYVRVFDEWDKRRKARRIRDRNERLLAEQKADRENRAFLAGHGSGIYGDFVPIDPETGDPMKVTRPDRTRLTSDKFKSQHRPPGDPAA